ncbi:protoporphyrinogen oxidase HemJ [Minwuia sp.]|uniref:protoporphyrinogen oxidase HemJ n=1 Tax=Minwuia sp. TaxID=2493630 RepID=UPI003A94A039
MEDWYIWFKAFHVISVIAWMAGMLYLPRLYVYHCAAEAGSKQSEDFKVMERKLLRGIINPSMIAAWVFGGLMLWIGFSNEFLTMADGWLHLKLLSVIAMTVAHGMFAKWRKDFEIDRNTKSARFYRFWNEVPAVLMIVIVIMVIVKPF